MEEYMLRSTRLFWKNKDVLSDRKREVWDRWLRGQKFSYVKNVPPLFDDSENISYRFGFLHYFLKS